MILSVKPIDEKRLRALPGCDHHCIIETPKIIPFQTNNSPPGTPKVENESKSVL